MCNLSGDVLEKDFKYMALVVKQLIRHHMFLKNMHYLHKNKKTLYCRVAFI